VLQKTRGEEVVGVHLLGMVKPFPTSAHRTTSSPRVFCKTTSAVHHRRCRFFTILLMTGMMMPETCWDTNKYIIFWIYLVIYSPLCPNISVGDTLLEHKTDGVNLQSSSPVLKLFLRCPTPILYCSLSSHWPSFRFLKLQYREKMQNSRLSQPELYLEASYRTTSACRPAWHSTTDFTNRMKCFDR
jgi:hypothetical protein